MGIGIDRGPARIKRQMTRFTRFEFFDPVGQRVINPEFPGHVGMI
mgnify:CR=1 FL=1